MDVPADGPVGSADAQVNPGCACNQILTPTVLFDEEVTPTPTGAVCQTREIDISAYRTVVAHSRNVFSNTPPVPSVQLKLGDALGFVNSLSFNSHIVTIDPLQGRIMRFAWASSAGGCATHAFAVVGYR